ncbi:MAG: hypothetical protein U0T74_04990 [Chitinophagales bacterium]
MKRIWLTILLLPLALTRSSAQEKIIATATELIVAGNYNDATHYLDSILKRDKKNVDAWMMKGNVLLNKTLETLPADSNVTADDESIFQSEIIPKTAKIIPAKQVHPIEKYWRKCLMIDSQRADIRKGLCTLYAMALMKQELKSEILSLLRIEKDNDGEQAYRIAEYARKFKERGRFNVAMELYQFIAKRFPELAGLRCDIAAEYFYEGRMKEALTWLDSTYNFKTVDETSFLNGAFTYSELGYFDEAQNVLNTYSRIYQRQMDKFYYGLRLFADESENYPAKLNEFINNVDSNTYYTEVLVARKLISYTDSFSINDYRALIDNRDIPYYYKTLIHQRAFKQFKNECDPFFLYGMFQSSIKNYPAAIQFLEEDESCKMISSEKEYRQLHYAYSLFMSGEKEKSLKCFRLLFTSSNAFTQQAAKYFAAKTSNVEEAQKLYHEIIAAKQNTKYGHLAKRQLR